MKRSALDMTRVVPDLRGSPCQGRRPGSEQPMHSASSVRLYGRTMDQFPCTGGIGDQAVKRDAHVIAVVDDDRGFRDALQLFLRTFAFQVDAFASGEEFLRSSRLDAVGCVILDLAMPEMNGLEVKEQLAARGLQIPIG
jgi:Response regulator receiver domain